MPLPALPLRLTLDVSYIPNGTSAKELTALLHDLVERAKGEGLLTGSTEAEVESVDVKVAQIEEPLTEDDLADFMLERIEGGSLHLEDIPTRLARYGLMDPNSFVAEMRERMQSRGD